MFKSFLIYICDMLEWFILNHIPHLVQSHTTWGEWHGPQEEDMLQRPWYEEEITHKWVPLMEQFRNKYDLYSGHVGLQDIPF